MEGKTNFLRRLKQFDLADPAEPRILRQIYATEYNKSKGLSHKVIEIDTHYDHRGNLVLGYNFGSKTSKVKVIGLQN